MNGEQAGQAGPKGDQGVQGVQGERGEQGRRGEPLNPAARRALIYLFFLSVLIGGLNLFWTSYEVNANNRYRCSSLEGLASIPIPQPVAGHESRQFAAALEARYQARARQLGCPKRKR